MAKIQIKTRVDIDGLKELDAALKALGKPSTIRRVLRPAVMAGARIIRRRAKALVPVKHGHLRKSIAAKVKTYRNGNVVGVVGPRSDYHIVRRSEVTGNIQRIRPSNYAHLVEKGHAIKFSKKGPVVGHVPARPFMKPAFEGGRAEIGAAMKSKVQSGLEREAAKAAAKGARR